MLNFALVKTEFRKGSMCMIQDAALFFFPELGTCPKPISHEAGDAALFLPIPLPSLHEYNLLTVQGFFV
jgi:hypothetical protein